MSPSPRHPLPRTGTSACPNGPRERRDTPRVDHVYLSRELTPRAMDAARALGRPLVVHDDPDRPPSRERLLDDVRGAAALIMLLTERVDDELLDAAGPQLRVVANCAVGYDNVSVDSATARKCATSPARGGLL